MDYVDGTKLVIGSKSICYTLFKEDFKKFIDDNNDIPNNLFSEVNVEKGF